MEPQLRILTSEERSPELLDALLALWRASVAATHTFLTPAEIEAIAPQAKAGLEGIETLVVLQADGQPAGFIGVQDRKIEMLFLHPTYFRRGWGKLLVQHAFDALAVKWVDVNEQNPQARHFYEHMGFVVVRRDALDSEGRTYPILAMERKAS